ncbi:hypothetical protein [Alienimonas californiensis]|uniref:Uncharacterized protein n=1 Tax=Alienimonas californiensis TaxID=2527989 RepID=A0A517P6U9_9PLAN|nr:hypothetical protein [Alienimonas californiensis]QDT15099.1 hypothetical protein CA12_11800 [Alienimonas californiensis]
MTDAEPQPAGEPPANAQPAARTPDAALAASSSEPTPDPQARAFAWLFGAAGLCVLVCCGGGLTWANGVEKTDRPERVREISAALFAAEIPERFEPEQALGVPPPPIVGWFQEGRTDLVDYATAGGGRLILSRRTNDDVDPAVAVAAAAADLNGSAGGEAEVRTVVTRDGREYPVALGSTAALTADGDLRPGDPEPGASEPGTPAGPVRRAFGMFREGSSSYVVQLTLPESEYDEAEVLAFLKSLGPADE